MKKKSYMTFLLTVLGTGLSILFNIYLARTTSIKVFAEYSYFVSTVSLTSTFLLFGISTHILKYFPVYFETNCTEKITSDLNGYFRIFIFISILIIMVLYSLSPGKEGLIYLNAFIMALLGVTCAIARSRSLFYSAVILNNWLRPILILVSILMIGTVSYDSEELISIYTEVNAIILIAGLLYYTQKIKLTFCGLGASSNLNKLKLMTFMLVSLMSILVDNAPILVLGYNDMNEAVSLFRMTALAGGIISFSIMSATNVSLPAISLAIESKNYALVSDLSKKISLFSLKLTSVMMITFIFVGSYIPIVIGPEYADVYPAIIIMFILKIISMTLGAPGSILLISGDERMVLVIWLVCLLIFYTIGYLLTLYFGFMAFVAMAGCSEIALNFILHRFFGKKYDITLGIYK